MPGALSLGHQHLRLAVPRCIQLQLSAGKTKASLFVRLLVAPENQLSKKHYLIYLQLLLVHLHGTHEDKARPLAAANTSTLEEILSQSRPLKELSISSAQIHVIPHIDSLWILNSVYNISKTYYSSENIKSFPAVGK